MTLFFFDSSFVTKGHTGLGLWTLCMVTLLIRLNITQRGELAVSACGAYARSGARFLPPPGPGFVTERAVDPGQRAAVRLWHLQAEGFAGG